MLGRLRRRYPLIVEPVEAPSPKGNGQSNCDNLYIGAFPSPPPAPNLRQSTGCASKVRCNCRLKPTTLMLLCIFYFPCSLLETSVARAYIITCFCMMRLTSIMCADLNHVVHACSHPGWREEPYESEHEMFADMHIYIERLVDVTRRVPWC